MRKKELSLIISFATTTEAMHMEKYCKQEQLAGRLIPIPREITAGCGLAWKTKPELQPLFIEKLNGQVAWEAMHVIEI